jgi:hypothetical protein
MLNMCSSVLNTIYLSHFLKQGMGIYKGVKR